MPDTTATNKPPAFQFYPADFLSDFNVQHMTLEEIGAYWKLVSHCWLEESLPADLSQLARVLGVTRKKMENMWVSVGPCFIAVDGDRLRHARLDKERELQIRRRNRLSEAGKKGGRPSGKPVISDDKARLSENKSDGKAFERLSSSSSSSLKETPISPTGESGAKKKKRNRPEDWKPNEKHAALAESEGVDLDRQAELFTGWADANGRQFVNWDIAFTNWLLRARSYERVGAGGGGGGSQVGVSFPEGY